MKKVLLSVILVAFLILMTGCKNIDYGIVKEKRFSPSHRVYSPMIMVVNKKTKIIPRWITKSDSWSILVENDDGSDWWNVSEEYFNSVEVGEFVDRRKD